MEAYKFLRMIYGIKPETTLKEYFKDYAFRIDDVERLLSQYESVLDSENRRLAGVVSLSNVLGGKSESEFYYTIEFVNNYIHLDIKNINTDELIKFIAVQTFDELITEIKRQELLSA
jgi:hypothetical protein